MMLRHRPEMSFTKRFALSSVAILALSFGVSGALADAISDFYTGKTLTIIVGADSGGGYDAQARLMSRHIGRFIPGNPTVIVQNMPGAGSLTAANQLYNVSPKDGTIMGLLQRGVFSAKFTNPQGVRFDLAKFNWVGNLSSETAVVIAWSSTPFQKIEDVMKQEMLVGGTGPHIDTETTPRMLNALIGTKFKIISGYPGTTEAVLAMERGEVQGMGDWSWSNVKTRKPDFLRDKKIRVLLQVATEKMPDLQDVPLAMDYVKTPEDRQVMELFLAQKSAARPVVAPPGIPAERIAAIRSGFDKMIVDAEFLKDAHSAKLEIDPAPAASIERVIKIFAATSEQTGQRLKDAIDPRGAK
ncbi:MAG: tripartite tricarboxylate transporter family receptor [Hyphomicrobiales bacterium]|nr:tripartite tricarboxylate transporter family receptor [Hyphomicrobiales bacterium]